MLIQTITNLIYYKKASGKARIPYDDAVEEALCFGWIDSTVKSFDKESTVQRYTPRNPKSNWSQLNKERARMLIERGLMTPAGLSKLGNVLDEKFEMPKDILKKLKKDKEAWGNFKKFPERYKRIRIAFIDGSRVRPEVFEKRLNYFIKMTKLNKKFGMVQ